MERCNSRTMEIYRRLGIAERIRVAGLPRNAPMDVFLALSMAEPALAHLPCPSVAEAKAEIVKIYNERQANEKTKFTGISGWEITNPEQLRFRDIFLSPVAPRNIFMNNETVSMMTRNLIISTPEIAVQKLPDGEKETKNHKDTIVFFLQEFFPETFQLGKRFEFETNDDEEISNFKDRLSKKTGINHIALASGESWVGHPILEIPTLRWQDSVPENASSYYCRVLSLHISDGTLVLFKDASKELCTLDEETKKQLLETDKKRRHNLLHASRSHSSKSLGRRMGGEQAVRIKEKDIVLDDV